MILTLGILECDTFPIEVNEVLWTPSWEIIPRYVYDGQQLYDFSDTHQRADLRALMEAAELVIVHRMPFACAHWNVSWWDVSIAEKAHRLGEEVRSVDVLEMAHRYRKEGVNIPHSKFVMSPDVCTLEQLTLTEAQQQLQALHQATEQLYKAQAQLLPAQLQAHLLCIEMPAAAVHYQMTATGVRISSERSALLKEKGNDLLNQLQVSLQAQGIVDPTDDAEIRRFFRAFGIELNTNKDRDLKPYEHRFPVVRSIRKYRRLKSILSQPWVRGKTQGPDGRVHPYHLPLQAPTGRTATKQPAITGVPKELRPLIIPADGYGIIELDYGSNELAICAVRFNDQSLMEAYKSSDVMSYLTRVVFQSITGACPVDDIKGHFPEYRQQTKSVAYGVLYGRTSFGLSQSLGISKGQADVLMSNLFSHCPKVYTGLKASVRYARTHREIPIVNGLNRKLIPDDWSRSHRIESLAKNTPIQGLAAVVFRIAMVQVAKVIKPYGGRLIMPNHDSLIIEGPIDSLSTIAQVSKIAMQDAFMVFLDTELRPRVDIDLNATDCWNKDGHADSFERFMEDPTYRI